MPEVFCSVISEALQAGTLSGTVAGEPPERAVTM